MFAAGGHCRYGDNCQYAHGDHEVRASNNTPNWGGKMRQNGKDMGN